MGSYYFLAGLLPDLEVGHPPSLPYPQLRGLFHSHLSAKDYQKFVTLRLYVDIDNLRSFWLGGGHFDSFDPRGNFNQKELEEALFWEQELPEYVVNFIHDHERPADKLKHFPKLVNQYFREEIEKQTGFLREYLTFEREWRLVLLGFRAKVLGRDLSAELQFEDPFDLIVHQIMAQKDAKSYEPPAEYQELKHVFESHKDDPLALHKALCHFRFNRIERMVDQEIFSIDRILAFVVQLAIVEKWQELDEEEGRLIVDTIVKENII